MHFQPDINTSAPITGLKPLNKTYLTDSEFDDHKRRLAFLESLRDHPRGQDPEISLKFRRVHEDLKKALRRGRCFKIPRYVEQYKWELKRLAKEERQVIKFVVEGKELSERALRRENFENTLSRLLNGTERFVPIARPKKPLISQQEMAGLEGKKNAMEKFWNYPCVNRRLNGFALIVMQNFFEKTCKRAAAAEFSEEGRRCFDIIKARISRLEHLIILAFVKGRKLKTLVRGEFGIPNNPIPANRPMFVRI